MKQLATATAMGIAAMLRTMVDSLMNAFTPQMQTANGLAPDRPSFKDTFRAHMAQSGSIQRSNPTTLAQLTGADHHRETETGVFHRGTDEHLMGGQKHHGHGIGADIQGGNSDATFDQMRH